MRASSILAHFLIACTAIAQSSSIAQRFPTPPGATRSVVEPGSFAHYLRHLPLKPLGSPVLLYDGSPKPRQDVHAAVIDVSVGKRDLQQCADAVMRLRAEHLFASGRSNEIAFKLTNGFKAEWKRWRNGERVVVNGNECRWVRTAVPDSSHQQLLAFMDLVFTYAGTLSLSRELTDASKLPIEPGDIFIKGGSPGHAMLVVDVARGRDGKVHFLLAQSYMPAQDAHIVRNPDSREGAWYVLEGDALRTPEWTFTWGDRKRWP